MPPGVSAAARAEGLQALRAAGADVDDDEVSALISQFRAAINQGRAPRSKNDEIVKVLVALRPTVERLAVGNPSVSNDDMQTALWSFVEGAVRGTQAEARLRRVAGEEAGWATIAAKAWARAIGEDDDYEGLDWVLHLGLGVLVTGMLVILPADSGRHRVSGAASAVGGIVLLARRVPPRVGSWWARWRRRSAYSAACEKGGDGLEVTGMEAEEECCSRSSARGGQPGPTAWPPAAAVEPGCGLRPRSQATKT